MTNHNLIEREHQPRKMKIPVIKLKQGNHEILVSYIKAGDLPFFTKVSHYDSNKSDRDPKQGYQRHVGARYKGFGNWLAGEDAGNRPLMPTAILLSKRDVALSVSREGEITLDSEDKLRIVDGQHRTKAYEYAINDKKQLDMATHEIPVLILNGLTKKEEMEQFRIVNGSAKSVPTDLVNRLLSAEMRMGNGESIDPKTIWKIIAGDALEAMNSEGGVFEEMIIMPNDTSPSKKQIQNEPSLANKRFVKTTSIITSLKPLISPIDNSILHHNGIWQTVGVLDKEVVTEMTSRLQLLLESFWGGLRQQMPECFDDARNHVLLKSPGFFSMHTLLKEIIMDMWRSRIDFEDFSTVIPERIQKFAESNEGAMVTSEYWHSKGTDASAYGSMKGFAVLGGELASAYRKASPSF